MTESPPELGEENEARLDRLHKVLAESQGFELIIVEVEPGWLREEVLRRLRAWAGNDGVPPLDAIELPPGGSVITALGRRDAGVVVLGLDQAESAGGSPDDMIAALNWSRDELPALVAGPMILIVDDATRVALFDRAPDLHSWRRHSVVIELPWLWAAHAISRVVRHPGADEQRRIESMLDQLATRPTTKSVHLGLLHRLAELVISKGDSQRATQLLEQGAAWMSDAAPDAVARHYLIASQIADAERDAERSEIALAHAEEAMVGLDDAALEGRRWMARSYRARAQSHFAEATTYLDQAAAAFERAGDRWNRVQAVSDALLMSWADKGHDQARLDELMRLLDEGDPEIRYSFLLQLSARARVTISRAASSLERRRIGDAFVRCAEAWGNPDAIQVARMFRDELLQRK